MGNAAQAEGLLPVSHAIKSIIVAEGRMFDSDLETTSRELIDMLSNLSIVNMLKSSRRSQKPSQQSLKLTIRQVDLKTRRQGSDAFNDAINHQEYKLQASTCQDSITSLTLAFEFGWETKQTCPKHKQC